MGHDKAGAALHHGVESFLDADLRPCIDGGSCFVQEQHGRQAQHHPGNTQQLLLALGQIAAGLADDRIIPLGQTADETVGVGRLGCSHHFVHSCLRLAHGDIFPDGARPEPGILQHHAHTAPQLPPVHIHSIDTVQADLAALRVVEAHEQIDKGGLAAARGTDDGYPLARLNGKVKIPDQRLGRIIGEMYVPDLHTAPDQLGTLRVFRFRTALRRFDQIKDPAGAGQGILQFCDHAGYLIEGFGVLVGIAEEAGQVTHRNTAAHGDQCACQRHTGIDQGVDEPGSRIGQRGKEDGPQRAFLQSPVYLVKLLQRLLFMAKGLDDLHLANGLVNDGRLLASGLGLELEHRIGTLGDKVCHQQRNRRDAEDHQGDLPVHDQHQRQGTHNGQ